MSPLKCVITCESMTGSIWAMKFSYQYLYGVTNIVSYFGWFIGCKSCPMEGLLGVVFGVGAGLSITLPFVLEDCA